MKSNYAKLAAMLFVLLAGLIVFPLRALCLETRPACAQNVLSPRIGIHNNQIIHRSFRIKNPKIITWLKAFFARITNQKKEAPPLARLVAQGLSKKEARLIMKHREDPSLLRKFHEYSFGIARLTSIIKQLQGPTILVIEGERDSGKSFLAKRLATGEDLGVSPEEISVVPGDLSHYTESQLILIRKAIIRKLKENKKILIYEGDFFFDDLVFEVVKPFLQNYNVIKIKIQTIRNKENHVLNKEGRFIDFWQVPDFEEAMSSTRRYIEISSESIVQKAIWKTADLAETWSEKKHSPFSSQLFDHFIEQGLSENEVRLIKEHTEGPFWFRNFHNYYLGIAKAASIVKEFGSLKF